MSQRPMKGDDISWVAADDDAPSIDGSDAKARRAAASFHMGVYLLDWTPKTSPPVRQSATSDGVRVPLTATSRR
jgi:hypothetical protein